MTAGHELVVERLMDAPVAALWTAYTDHLNEWFCPPPWRAEVQEMDLRAGGRSAIAMYGPDGEVMPNEGVYLEVIPERLIVFTDAFTHGWNPAGPFMVGSFEFEPRGDQTLYRAARATGRPRQRLSMRRWVSKRAGARSPNNGKRSPGGSPGDDDRTLRPSLFLLLLESGDRA